jgi:solute carrier family 38 (sodium-coupled neutral amino acid transporter), member 11
MIVVGSILKKTTSIAVLIALSWWWSRSADAFLLHRRCHTTTLPRRAPRSSRRALLRPRLVVGRRGGGGTETATFPLKSSSSPIMSNSNSNGTNKHNPTSNSTSTTASSVSSFAHVAGVTFNVVKAMLGTGMLALPMGVAATSNYRPALLPASLLMVTLALLSAYTFALYGRLAHALAAPQKQQPLTLGEIWRTLGRQRGETRDTSAVISLTNFMFCFGCCLSISQILGDTFSSLARGLMMSSTTTAGRTAGSLFSLPAAWLVSRPAAILVVTTAFLLPLCRLKSLAALAPFSIVGVMGALTTVGFLGYRCPAVFPQSPYAVGGVWAVAAASAPGAAAPFGTYSRIVSLAPLSLVSMSCIALMAHFSAIDFYQALIPPPAVPPNNKNHLPPSGTGTGGAEASSSSSSSSLVLRNYMTMTTASFAVTAVISILAMTFGFLTFGANSAGNILNNYHVNDGGAIFSRLLCGISLIGSFPMIMRPCQSSALELFGLPPTDRNNARMTTALLAVVTTLALTVKNVGFVISLNGAIMGTSLVYTIPCLLFLKLTSQNKQARITTGRTTTGVTATTTTRLKVERAFCRLLIAFGVTAMVAGAASAVITSFYPKWLS